MANMAILRVAKIKTMSSLAARGKHNFRERETPNADAERTPLNLVAGARSTDGLMQQVSDLLPAKRRKDAVIGLEYLITASPEHFGADWRERKDFGTEYFNDAIKWLQQRHGAENVVCATVHLDESTPHLVAFVVPRTKDGRLAAKDFVGGAAKLSKMQTEFAKEVGQKHGLERGVEWSKAVHKPNAAIAPMTAERLALRKQVKELEAEIERLTQQVTASSGALEAAKKRFQHQQQINVEGLAVERQLRGELAAAQARIEQLEGEVKRAAERPPKALPGPTAAPASPERGKAQMEEKGPATVEEAQRAAIRAEEKRLGRPLGKLSPEAAEIRKRVRAEWEAALAPQPGPVVEEVKELERAKPAKQVTLARPTGRGGR